MPDWEHWELRIRQWATERPDILTVVVIGSQARREPPADDVSDLDLMLYVDDYSQYTTSSWLADLGTVLVAVYEPWPRSIPEHLVFFDDTAKIDFAFLPFTELQAAVNASTLPDGFQRGYTVLVDKTGISAQLPAPPISPVACAPPGAAEFVRAVNSFWFWALRTAQAIWRDELWVAMTRYRKLQDHLLQMVEWHTQSTSDHPIDTWHSGRFMAKWAAPDAVTRVARTGFVMDRADAWHSLEHMTALFGDLAGECASRLGFVYPRAMAERMITLMVERRAGS